MTLLRTERIQGINWAGVHEMQAIPLLSSAHLMSSYYNPSPVPRPLPAFHCFMPTFHMKQRKLGLLSGLGTRLLQPCSWGTCLLKLW